MYDVPQGDVCSDNPLDFPCQGAIQKSTLFVHLFHMSKNISFPSLLSAVV